MTELLLNAHADCLLLLGKAQITATYFFWVYPRGFYFRHLVAPISATFYLLGCSFTESIKVSCLGFFSKAQDITG